MTDSDEIDWLAAQYAIGVLSPAERRLLQARISQDPLLAAAIDAWERRLAPLSLREPGLAPSSQVLEGLLAALARKKISDQLQAPASPAVLQPHAAGMTRRKVVGLAIAASLGAAAIGLGTVLVDRAWRPAGALAAMLVPVQQSATADEPQRAPAATFLATFDPHTRLLTIRRGGGEAARADRVHVLWSVSGADADTIVIGRLEREGPTVMQVDDMLVRGLERNRLVVTLEAEGFATRPRGPAIASGQLARPQ